MTDQIHVIFSEEGEACAIRKWSKEPFDDAQTYVPKAERDTLAARVLELEAENKRLREENENLIYALENLEEESLTHYMRTDSATRVKCTLCGADDFMPSSLNHRQGCAVGVARAALKGGEI